MTSPNITIDTIEEKINAQKIKNGSIISTGKTHKINIIVDKHFNYFQKKMIKICFGFDVKNYSEK